MTCILLLICMTCYSMNVDIPNPDRCVCVYKHINIHI